MRVVEMLLRLGVSLVGWMVIYTHCVWTATLNVTGCGADGDALWRLILGFAPFTIAFCLLLNVSHKLKEVHKILRLLAWPMVVFLPLAVYATWPWFVHATLDGKAICGGGSASTWHVWWAPIQFLVFTAIAGSIWRVWRTSHQT